MKVTIHPGSRERLPALVRDLLAVADDRAQVTVASAGWPGVTVDAATAVRFLTGSGPADRPLTAAPQPVEAPEPLPPVVDADAPPDAPDKPVEKPTERRRGGRPRKSTTPTARSEG